MSFEKNGNYRETTFLEKRNLQYETWKGREVESLSFSCAGVKDIGEKIVADLQRMRALQSYILGGSK